jgi:hypothetical protein
MGNHAAASALPTLELLCEREDKIGFFGHTHEPDILSDRDGLLDWLGESRVKKPAGLACAVMVGAVGKGKARGRGHGRLR